MEQQLKMQEKPKTQVYSNDIFVAYKNGLTLPIDVVETAYHSDAANSLVEVDQAWGNKIYQSINKPPQTENEFSFLTGLDYIGGAIASTLGAVILTPYKFLASLGEGLVKKTMFQNHYHQNNSFNAMIDYASAPFRGLKLSELVDFGSHDFETHVFPKHTLSVFKDDVLSGEIQSAKHLPTLNTLKEKNLTKIEIWGIN